jgi:hypothetical protein
VINAPTAATAHVQAKRRRKCPLRERRRDEQMFAMLPAVAGRAHGVEQIEQMRRSAACAQLSRTTVEQILDGYVELARRQREIERILGQLLPAWRSARDSLNRLAAVMREAGGADGIE